MALNVSGGLFNFTDNTYTPPALSGEVYELNPGGPGRIIQLYATSTYVFTATNTGLEVYKIADESKTAKITYASGYVSIHGNSTFVYLGTPNDGVKRLAINTITGEGDETNPQDLASYLADWANEPNLTNNAIRYLHATEDSLLVTTVSGIDYFKTTGNPTYRSYTTTNSGAYQCFMTNQQAYYVTITTSGTQDIYSINRLNSALTDWAAPDYVYYTGGIIDSNRIINDIFVTYGTAEDGQANTIFCATNSGVYVIDESNNYCDVYYTTTAG